MLSRSDPRCLRTGMVPMRLASAFNASTFSARSHVVTGTLDAFDGMAKHILKYPVGRQHLPSATWPCAVNRE